MEMASTMINNQISGGMATTTTNKPAWLQALMAETFFGTCLLHENLRKCEKNVFCLHCCLSVCPHCLSSHRSHPLLQPYTINGAKVIFLNYRPQSRPCKQGSSNVCFTCDRILQEPFHFCSLSCKVDHMVYEGEDLCEILRRFEVSDFSFSQFEGLRVDGVEEDAPVIAASSVVEDPISSSQFNKGSSCSNANTSSGTHIFKRKNKGADFLPAGIVLSLTSRRKGAPQRAPLS